MKRKDWAIRALACVLALIVINLISSRHGYRLDLTADQEYTLADSTNELLQSLNDIVTIRVYFSHDLPPQLKSVEQSLTDLLDEYRRHANGNVRVEYLDPTKDPQTEMQTQMMGIPPIQLNVIESDKRQVVKVYLGMAIVHGDKQEVVPLIESIQNAEYLITSSILKITESQMPVIGWWKGPHDDQFHGARESLGKRYTIHDMDVANPTFPDGMSALVMLDPGTLPPSIVRALDEYINKGGKVVVALEKVAVSNALAVMPQSLDGEGWLKPYGISFSSEIVADRSNAYAAFAGGAITYQIPYPYWVMIKKEGMDESHPITARLEQVVFPWASPIMLDSPLPEGITPTILARTTAYAGVVPVEDGKKVALDPTTANRVLDEASGGMRVLAVVLQKGAGQLMVTGNAAWISDRFLQQFPDNRLLLDNTVDYLGMGDALIGIRSRGESFRPIRDLTETQMVVVKYGTMGMALAAVLIGGGVVMWRRRRWAERARRRYAA